MESSPSPEAFLPLTPAMFHIILALAAQDRHGYGIMQEVQALTDGSLRLGPGTLYRTIKHLLSLQLIAEADERLDPALDDERRRYYHLTPLGRAVGQAAARQLAKLVGHAQSARLLGNDATMSSVQGEF